MGLTQQPEVWIFPDCHHPASCRKFLRDLTSYLADKYQPQLIFDLSQVQTMNADGIDLLLNCLMRISSCDGELRLAGASLQTCLVLELTQLDHVVEVYPSVEKALAGSEGRFISEGLGASERAA